MTYSNEYIQPTPRRLYAMILMIISSTVISFGGLIIRNIETADTWQINFYRSIAFAMAIGLVLVFRYRKSTLRQFSGIGWFGIIAGFLLAFAGIAFLQAITNTTVAATLFTLSSIPFITAAFAWFFLREKIKQSTFIAMVFAAIGIFIMILEGFSFGTVFGNLMAFLCALGFSGYATIIRRNRSVDMLPTFVVSSLIVILIVLFVKSGNVSVPIYDLILCFTLGGIVAGFSNALFIISSRHLLAAELTFFMLLEFTLGPIWVWLFINEVPTQWTIIGGLIVILSVIFNTLSELHQSKK
ncbi:MAG: DMT family transporter [Paracoccaceae bacterium]